MRNHPKRARAPPEVSLILEIISSDGPIGRALGKSVSSGKNDSLTYAAAGVSVDNGNALVDAIKPIVKATRRPGADGEIGGFGGAFDLKSAGFRDPVLVSGTDGVGTKLRVALDCGIHTSVGKSRGRWSGAWVETSG